VIRVLALGLFRRDGRILVAGGSDPLTGERYFRPLGGGVEVGERADEALRREIGEELGAVATDLRLLGVIENIFDYAGAMRHEVVFVFDAAFADASLYGRDELPVVEAGAGWAPARWMHPGDFGEGRPRLVPPALLDLVRQGAPAPALRTARAT
jgi:ADP-ribose pyrophosphatase YjhB (NUDIX family)